MRREADPNGAQLMVEKPHEYSATSTAGRKKKNPSLMDRRDRKITHWCVSVCHMLQVVFFGIEVFTSSVIVFFFFWGRGSLRA